MLNLWSLISVGPLLDCLTPSPSPFYLLSSRLLFHTLFCFHTHNTALSAIDLAFYISEQLEEIRRELLQDSSAICIYRWTLAPLLHSYHFILHPLCTSSHPFSLLLRFIAVTTVLSFCCVSRFPHVLAFPISMQYAGTSLILKTLADLLFFLLSPIFLLTFVVKFENFSLLAASISLNLF